MQCQALTYGNSHNLSKVYVPIDSGMKFVAQMTGLYLLLDRLLVSGVLKLLSPLGL